MHPTNPVLDTAAYTTVGMNSIQGIGAYPAYPQPPVVNTMYDPGHQYERNTYGFKVCKVENGWTIAINGKQWICATPQELGDRMVTILVEERLDK